MIGKKRVRDFKSLQKPEEKAVLNAIATTCCTLTTPESPFMPLSFTVR